MSAGLHVLLVATASLAFAEAYPQPKSEAPLELFLLIGQSNMAGRGQVEPADRVSIPGVYVLDKNLEWRPAVDPLHYDNPSIDAAGLGRSFARVLLQTRPSARIGLIPAALGGTSLDQWQPGGALYLRAISRTQSAQKAGTLRGILWHQGESDAQSQQFAITYSKRFVEFIRALRQDLDSPDVPVLIGQLGEFSRFPFTSIVDEQLALLPLKVPRCAFISAVGLVHKGDEVHFDTRSLREFGRRYACAFLGLEPSWMSHYPSSR